MARPTLLITGSSGRLGAFLVRYFADAYDVVQFDAAPPHAELAGTGCVRSGSITDVDAAARAVEGVDAVIHAAALPGEFHPLQRLIEINVNGTFNMLEAAGASPRAERFIYISSLCYHGTMQAPTFPLPDRLPMDESQPHRFANYYCSSKYQAEYWCRKYVQQFRKPLVAIRPSWIMPCEEDEPITPRGLGDRPRFFDYVAAPDLARGIALALEYDPPHGFDAFLMNAGDQYCERPTAEVAERFFPGVPCDGSLLTAEAGYAALIDNSHARQALGWRPESRVFREEPAAG